LYAVLVVAAGSVESVVIPIAVPMVTLKAFSTHAPDPSVARTVMAKLPVVVVVPVNCPSVFKEIPVGNVPLDTVQVKVGLAELLLPASWAV